MIRLFTKTATGVAPDGVWFAGDVNALQDAVAALEDLTQNLQAATLAIGESGLQLVRYASGEARITGALRTDSIVRALGGVYAGGYTTSQRDALVNPPYALVITNTTTNRLEMNYGTPSVPDWGPIGLSSVGTSDIQDGAVTVPKLAALATTAKTASYTLVLADNGAVVEMASSGALTLTVPANASVAFPVGTVITVVQTGVGQVTLTPDAGVTVNANPGLKTNGQWAAATLLKRATNTWLAMGNLTP